MYRHHKALGHITRLYAFLTGGIGVVLLLSLTSSWRTTDFSRNTLFLSQVEYALAAFFGLCTLYSIVKHRNIRSAYEESEAVDSPYMSSEYIRPGVLPLTLFFLLAAMATQTGMELVSVLDNAKGAWSHLFPPLFFGGIVSTILPLGVCIGKKDIRPVYTWAVVSGLPFLVLFANVLLSSAQPWLGFAVSIVGAVALFLFGKLPHNFRRQTILAGK